MNNLSVDFIEKLPKTDLHVHLDGSLRIDSIIDIAKTKKIKLPSYTEEGLNELIFKEKYDSLDEYLNGFAVTCSVLNDKESLERVAYEFLYDNFNDGVRYVEVRFAPQLHMGAHMTFEDVMFAVDGGMKKAAAEININIPDDEPEVKYGIIVCAMRFCNEHFSEYYKHFFEANVYSSLSSKIKLVSLQLAKAAVKLRDSSDVKIVGFDLAGSEFGYPAHNHKKSYDYVHKHFLHKTVHAGEAYGPESIFQAITKLHADRIGHGLFLFDDTKVHSHKIKDRKLYVEELANYIANKRITIEVCLTSNLQTVPEIKNIKDHSFKKMLEHKLSLTLCTDNRLVSHTTVSKEIKLAVNNFDISKNDLKNIIIYGFKRSFFHGSYPEKRKYVRKVINYYEKLEKDYYED